MTPEQRYQQIVAEQAPIEAAAHDAFIEERSNKMLMDFESVEGGSIGRSHVCSNESCAEQAVVNWAAEENPRGGRWYPMCFHHAFVAALQKDPQAQRLALGWAIAEGLAGAAAAAQKLEAAR